MLAAGLDECRSSVWSARWFVAALTTPAAVLLRSISWLSDTSWRPVTLLATSRVT